MSAMSKKRSKRREQSEESKLGFEGSFHDHIEPGPPLHLRAALDAHAFDLAIDWPDDSAIYGAADRIAETVYRSYQGLEVALNRAMSEVQDKMGDEMFNRLEGVGLAVERRLVLAAYFLGVKCGRMAQPRSGGAA
jgi:hypothetical protein